MSAPRTDFETRAVAKVQALWHVYLLPGQPEELLREAESLPGNMVVIGTGRHEVYESRDAFLGSLEADRLEAQDIEFEVLDEWYAVQTVTPEVCVVYGTLWLREKAAPGKTVYVEMDSRFTAVCRDTPQGAEVCSVHHSLPYVDQGEDEYYPKTLSAVAEEALQKSRALEHRMELDGLTELLNRVAFEHHVAEALPKGGALVMLDLDRFKEVNDTLGHPAGDKLIRGFAQALRQAFGPGALVGRMGGDEFAVFLAGVDADPTRVDACFTALLDACGGLAQQIGRTFSCSAGAATVQPGEDFPALYRRADHALYHAKSQGKSRLCWAGGPAAP